MWRKRTPQMPCTRRSASRQGLHRFPIRRAESVGDLFYILADNNWLRRMTGEKRTQSVDEIERHFAEQLAFLNKSCDAYDSGDDAEAKRLSATLRLLLHNTRKSRGLVVAKGLGSIRFFDTADDSIPGNYAPTFGLVVMRLGAGWNRYWPRLFQGKTGPVWFRKFDEWWNHPVISIPDQFELTRRDLVLTMADQDGGAHVDPAIEERYYRITRENALGITAGEPASDIPQIETASIRQIAEEVRRSLTVASPTVDPGIKFEIETYCPCKSGFPYSRCHMSGAPNEGT